MPNVFTNGESSSILITLISSKKYQLNMGSIQDNVSASSLSRDVSSAIADYEATGKEADRMKALDQVSVLKRSLETPLETIFKTFISVG